MREAETGGARLGLQSRTQQQTLSHLRPPLRVPRTRRSRSEGARPTPWGQGNTGVRWDCRWWACPAAAVLYSFVWGMVYV